MTKTRLRRDKNGSLKIKTMTKSILTFVDETRRKCWWLTNSQNIFFSKLACTSHHWLNVAQSCIPPPLPEMTRHASDALTNVICWLKFKHSVLEEKEDTWTLFTYNLTENKTLQFMPR